MIEISAEIVLLNALQYRMAISHKELQIIRIQVEGEFTEIYVNIENIAINRVVSNYPHFFEIIESTGIKRGAHWSKVTESHELLSHNTLIPEKIRDRVLEMIMEA